MDNGNGTTTFHDPQLVAQLSGQAAIENTLDLSKLRAQAAIDQEVKLKNFAVLPGVHPDQLADGSTNPVAGQFDGNWYLNPLADHARGTWAEKGASVLSKAAVSQLCTEARMPREFVQAMPVNMQMAVANWSLQNRSGRDQSLLRQSTLSADLQQPLWRTRAILSSRYEALDDVMIFETLHDVLQDFPTAKLHHANLDDEFTRLNISFEDADLGDSKARVGVAITNSEIGWASLRVDSFVYRVVCMNGLVSKTGDGSFRFIHAGQRTGFREQLRGALYTSLEATKGTVKDYRTALQKPLLDAGETLRLLAKEQKLSQADLDNFMNAWLIEPQNNVAGVVNAITRAAQNEESAMARHNLEVLAGDTLHRLVAA